MRMGKNLFNEVTKLYVGSGDKNNYWFSSRHWKRKASLSQKKQRERKVGRQDSVRSLGTKHQQDILIEDIKFIFILGWLDEVGEISAGKCCGCVCCV